VKGPRSDWAARVKVMVTIRPLAVAEKDVILGAGADAGWPAPGGADDAGAADVGTAEVGDGSGELGGVAGSLGIACSERPTSAC